MKNMSKGGKTPMKPTTYAKGGKTPMTPTTYAKGGKTPLPGMKKPKSSSCK